MILLGVVFLAIIQGKNITDSLLGENVYIGGGEVQQIAFIILTLFILVVATLNPTRIHLASYSAMTLGLVVIVGALYNRFNNVGSKMGLVEIVLGFALILGGFFLFKGTRLNKKDREFAINEINRYMK